MASTAVGSNHIHLQFHFGTAAHRISNPPARFYAKKSRKMPPKKPVKEEKILLGRPGNNLKSGIVRKKTLFNSSWIFAESCRRWGWQMLENQHYFKLSQNALWVTPPCVTLSEAPVRNILTCWCPEFSVRNDRPWRGSSHRTRCEIWLVVRPLQA